MTFEVKLIFLEPRDIELLSRRPTLELPGNILLIISNDPAKAVLVYIVNRIVGVEDILGNNSCSTDTFSPLSD